MDHFAIDFDFATTARPAEVPVYNVAHEVVLAVGSVVEIHGAVTLRSVDGVVSVEVSYSWFGGMGRDRARETFVAALRQGQRRDGALRGSCSFLRAVKDALAEGATVR